MEKETVIFRKGDLTVLRLNEAPGGGTLIALRWPDREITYQPEDLSGLPMNLAAAGVPAVPGDRAEPATVEFALVQEEEGSGPEPEAPPMPEPGAAVPRDLGQEPVVE